MYKLNSDGVSARKIGSLEDHLVATSSEYLEWLADGNTPDPFTPSAADIQASFTAAIQARLDVFARTRGYDGILSACTYATSGNAQFAAEAAYCVASRDSTWAAGYQILGDVLAGTRTMPTLEEVMTELPALEWPQ